MQTLYLEPKTNHRKWPHDAKICILTNFRFQLEHFKIKPRENRWRESFDKIGLYLKSLAWRWESAANSDLRISPRIRVGAS